ncbi:EamA family transporter [Pedobacter metabolipauper]|uniref:Chloramphenicol-sensitive protein RarD n=1 Tax=Pedobacter metabolipauper TaxID=425513 RepID=A0A4R6SVE3_9SPHI|nr:EamA family transporter [Pedobacter metabolipauper]TDQ09351.1 chloramphenicol-sensitive protein RarD [Pedobacter metabolipauper]
MPKSNLKYFFAAILSVSIWGFFSIPLRNLKAYASDEILYYRVFTSLVLIWIAIFMFRRKQLKADLAYLSSVSLRERKLVLLQVTGATALLVLNWYTFIYAVNNVSLQSAAFAYMVCPLITAFGGFILLKEKLSRLQLFSLLIALVSIILLATGSFIEVLWSVVIALLYALYLIIQRKMQHLDKLHVLAVQIAMAVLMMLPFYLYHHESFPVETLFWGNIVIIALLFTIIPLFLSLYALIGIPSSTLGIIIYINPTIAFIVAILYFNETLDPNKLFAYSLLVASVLIFNWGILKDILTFKRKNI